MITFPIGGQAVRVVVLPAEIVRLFLFKKIEFLGDFSPVYREQLKISYEQTCEFY
jgi:hypothetical protein